MRRSKKAFYKTPRTNIIEVVLRNVLEGSPLPGGGGTTKPSEGGEGYGTREKVRNLWEQEEHQSPYGTKL